MTPPRTQAQKVAAYRKAEYPAHWDLIADAVKKAAGYTCVRCRHVHEVPTGYVLTVHHLDMNKANVTPYNLVALCQRCHLNVQGRVDFEQPYMGEHSVWLAPYVRYYEKARFMAVAANPFTRRWYADVRDLALRAIADRPECFCRDWHYPKPCGETQ